MNEQVYPLFCFSNPSRGLAYSFVRKTQSIIFYFRYIEACCHFAPPTFFGKFKPNPEKKIFIFPYTAIKRNVEAEQQRKQFQPFQTFWISALNNHELNYFSLLFDKIWQIFAFFVFSFLRLKNPLC
jgi:hypothetical protein